LLEEEGERGKRGEEKRRARARGREDGMKGNTLISAGGTFIN